jgi:hypothetical protein
MFNGSGYIKDPDQVDNTGLFHPALADSSTSAGLSSHLSILYEGGKAPAGGIGFPREEQEVTDADSGSDGGVLLA